MLTAEEILSIPLTNPGKLFPRDPAARHDLFKKLSKLWHPDMPEGRNDVFVHISILHDAAENGLWDGSHPLRIIEAKTGKQFDLKYYIHHPFELGDVYIGKTIVGYYIKREHEDLVLNGLKAIGSIRFPDNRMKDQHQKYLPFVERTIETADGYMVLIKKTEDLVTVADLVKHLGRLPPKHMAWVVSSLLNILCFYEIIGLTHNGLTPETVFVSPEHHAAFPLGGWWYAANVKQRLKWLPPAVHAIAPSTVIAKKLADNRIDLSCVRAIARFCVGDPNGSRLQNTADVPKPLANWLRLPSAKDAVTDYENWSKVLTASWGPRRFLNLDVDLSAIYG